MADQTHNNTAYMEKSVDGAVLLEQPQPQPQPQPPLYVTKQTTLPYDTPDLFFTPPPFDYAARFTIYGLVLPFSLTAFIFAVLILVAGGGIAVYELFNTSTAFLHSTVTVPDTRTIYIWFCDVFDFQRHHLVGYADTLDAALAPSFHPLSPSGSVNVVPSSGLVAAGVATVIVSVCSGLLFLLVGATLLVLRCHHRRAQRYAAVAAQALLQLEQAQRGAAAATLPDPSYAPPLLLLKEVARRQRQSAYDATVRRALALWCLLFSAVGLLLSVVAVVGTFSTVYSAWKAGDRALAQYPSAIVTVSNSDPMRNVLFFGSLIHLLLMLLATVLQCVPYFFCMAEEEAPGGGCVWCCCSCFEGGEEGEQPTVVHTFAE